MDYPPNIEAAAGFARDAMPAIRAAQPGNPLRDRRPQARSVAFGVGGEGIEVTGEVPDVRPWLKQADVVVAPLRIARGIQNKVLEAMAMGRPGVASPQAFEGHRCRARPRSDRRRCRRAGGGSLCAAADPARAEAIGTAARARVEARYAWDARLAPLDAMMARI